MIRWEDLEILERIGTGASGIVSHGIWQRPMTAEELGGVGQGDIQHAPVVMDVDVAVKELLMPVDELNSHTLKEFIYEIQLMRCASLFLFFFSLSFSIFSLFISLSLSHSHSSLRDVRRITLPLFLSFQPFSSQSLTLTLRTAFSPPLSLTSLSLSSFSLLSLFPSLSLSLSLE